jgi:hypothetical protein
VKKLLLVAAAAAFVAGCAPNYVNLTPTKVTPTPEKVYPFEVQWDSPRRGANNASVQAYVVIGTNFFPMTRIPNTPNRWEARVPLPPELTVVPYRFKFDYTYPGLPKSEIASDRSPEYQIGVPLR